MTRFTAALALSATTLVIIGSIALLVPTKSVAQICKWVDESGCVHYAETCPEGVDGEGFELQAPPTEEQIQAAKKRAKKTTQRISAQKTEKSMSGSPDASLSLIELGPLPENTESRFLTTVSTGILCDSRELAAQFTLRLKASRHLPRGGYVETRFPDPGGRGNQQVTGMTLEKPGADLLFLSPLSKQFRCRNYEVEVLVFGDDSKAELLGNHNQIIQSRLDMSKVRNQADLLKGLSGEFCPKDTSERSLAELEALCEQAREYYLRPERESAIKNCIEKQGKDPDYCERYYSTYGDATVHQRLVVPRKYDNLPECVAARKAGSKGR